MLQHTAIYPFKEYTSHCVLPQNAGRHQDTVVWMWWHYTVCLP